MRHTLTTLITTAFRRPTSEQSTRTTSTSTESTPPVEAQRTQQSQSTVSVHRVDDPYGSNVILAVSGRIGQALLESPTSLIRDVPTWWMVFVDLTDADIADAADMHCVESWIDELELQGYHLDVSGISPEHPALRS